jgi:hypothetical protein
MNLKEFKKLVEGIKEEDINFVSYFYTKKEERPDITDKLVREKLKDLGKILGVQKQRIKGKERYRVGIKLSNRYTLVVICETKEKGLYIITAWKTSRKWQKAIQK